MIISFGEIKTDDKFFKKIKILFIKFIKFYLLKANRYQKNHKIQENNTIFVVFN